MSTAVATLVKERPILFSAPMVRAILEGRKTQTRRLVLYKGNQPPAWATWVNHIRHPNMRMEWFDSNLFQWSEEQTPDQPLKTFRCWPIGTVKVTRKFSTEMDFAIPCPHGVPGDRLWVRETWTHTGTGVWSVADCEQAQDGKVLYAASDDAPCKGCWFPSIFMPRRYSRITLEIVKVRVERVQDIGEQDALTEIGGCGLGGGCCHRCNGAGRNHTWPQGCPDCHGTGHAHRYKFRELWDSINAKRGYGWDKNPWVWVIEFKRVTGAL